MSADSTDRCADRPRVWMVRRHDAPDYWIPFLHEPVDALKDPEREVFCLHWPEDIAAERERCAVLCERIASVCAESAFGARKAAGVAAAESCARLIRSGR